MTNVVVQKRVIDDGHFLIIGKWPRILRPNYLHTMTSNYFVSQKIIALSMVALFALCKNAVAATLVFTVSGVGSGSLDAVDFTDQPYTFVTTYDTSNITSFSEGGSNGFTVINDSAVVSINGVDTVITDPVTINVNNTHSALTLGNDRVFQDLFIIFGYAQLATYDLQTPLQFLAVTDGIISSTFAWETESGDLFLDGDDPAMFTMEIAIVPEPSTALLLSLGGIAFFRRKRCF